MSVTQKEMDLLVQWIREYLNKAVPTGKHQAIVGLSGGIDSAVIAALCVKAVGHDKVLGVILPCDSDPKDQDLAYELANKIPIDDVLEMDLEETFHRWWYDFRIALCPDERINRMIPANAKARLRMLTLYAAAARSGGLVVGTTNKTEAILGYATKYGDNGVDIEPLLEFYKEEVYEIATLVNASSQRSAGEDQIPFSIISRAPTAGLWEGQTDEGELGMTYDQIDFLLMQYDINELCRLADGEISSTKTNTEAAVKIAKLYRANLHKDFHLPHYIRKPEEA